MRGMTYNNEQRPGLNKGHCGYMEDSLNIQLLKCFQCIIVGMKKGQIQATRCKENMNPDLTSSSFSVLSLTQTFPLGTIYRGYALFMRRHHRLPKVLLSLIWQTSPTKIRTAAMRAVVSHVKSCQYLFTTATLAAIWVAAFEGTSARSSTFICRDCIWQLVGHVGKLLFQSNPSSWVRLYEVSDK